MSSNAGAARAWLVYDGECPLCNSYARYADVKRQVGELVLVDARKGGPLVAELKKSFDLDDGMVLKLDDCCYYGPDALRMLARLSGGRGAFSRIARFLFGDEAGARLGYPLLKMGRRVLLGLRGVGPIPRSGEQGR